MTPCGCKIVDRKEIAMQSGLFEGSPLAQTFRAYLDIEYCPTHANASTMRKFIEDTANLHEAAKMEDIENKRGWLGCVCCRELQQAAQKVLEGIK